MWLPTNPSSTLGPVHPHPCRPRDWARASAHRARKMRGSLRSPRPRLTPSLTGARRDACRASTIARTSTGSRRRSNAWAAGWSCASVGRPDPKLEVLGPSSEPEHDGLAPDVVGMPPPSIRDMIAANRSLGAADRFCGAVRRSRLQATRPAAAPRACGRDSLTRGRPRAGRERRRSAAAVPQGSGRRRSGTPASGRPAP
jgi:hypothetical protein